MFRFLCLLLFSTLLVGCNHAESTSAEKVTRKAAYDSKSKKAFAVDSSVQLPTRNPENSKSKLQPALYCSECKKWYPAPPLEELNRNPGAAKCPKTGAPLSLEGPLPKQTIVFTEKGE